VHGDGLEDEECGKDVFWEMMIMKESLGSQAHTYAHANVQIP
jgi:hypothetical protein